MQKKIYKQVSRIAAYEVSTNLYSKHVIMNRQYNEMYPAGKRMIGEAAIFIENKLVKKRAQRFTERTVRLAELNARVSGRIVCMYYSNDGEQYVSTGSGFVIGEKSVMTAAHVVNPVLVLNNKPFFVEFIGFTLDNSHPVISDYYNEDDKRKYVQLEKPKVIVPETPTFTIGNTFKLDSGKSTQYTVWSWYSSDKHLYWPLPRDYEILTVSEHSEVKTIGDCKGSLKQQAFSYYALPHIPYYFTDVVTVGYPEIHKEEHFGFDEKLTLPTPKYSAIEETAYDDKFYKNTRLATSSMKVEKHTNSSTSITSAEDAKEEDQLSYEQCQKLLFQDIRDATMGFQRKTAFKGKASQLSSVIAHQCPTLCGTDGGIVTPYCDDDDVDACGNENETPEIYDFGGGDTGPYALFGGINLGGCVINEQNYALSLHDTDLALDYVKHMQTKEPVVYEKHKAWINRIAAIHTNKYYKKE